MTADTSKSLDLHAHPTGASPAASAELTKALKTLDLFWDDWTEKKDIHDAMLVLAAHVATLTSKSADLQARLQDVSAKLEAERAAWAKDKAFYAQATFKVQDYARELEAARDAAVAEAKALREVIARVEWGGLTQTGYDGDVTSCCPDPACNALINTEHSTDCAIRATLAQPADTPLSESVSEPCSRGGK